MRLDEVFAAQAELTDAQLEGIVGGGSITQSQASGGKFGQGSTTSGPFGNSSQGSFGKFGQASQTRIN